LFEVSFHAVLTSLMSFGLSKQLDQRYISGNKFLPENISGYFFNFHNTGTKTFLKLKGGHEI